MCYLSEKMALILQLPSFFICLFRSLETIDIVNIIYLHYNPSEDGLNLIIDSF